MGWIGQDGNGLAGKDRRDKERIGTAGLDWKGRTGKDWNG